MDSPNLLFSLFFASKQFAMKAVAMTLKSGLESSVLSKPHVHTCQCRSSNQYTMLFCFCVYPRLAKYERSPYSILYTPARFYPIIDKKNYYSSNQCSQKESVFFGSKERERFKGNNERNK